MKLSKIQEEPTICFSLLILFFLFQFQLVFFTSSVSSENTFAINCGFSGNSDTTSQSDQRKWTPDGDNSNSNSNLFYLIQNGQTPSTSAEVQVPSSLEKSPYSTARLSQSEFAYSFNVTDGKKFVRLFFYPASYSKFGRSNALFSVKAGQHTLLKDFNASLTADNDDDDAVTVFREYSINVEPGHRLNITFTPSNSHPEAYAFINGIEVASMPINLYYTKPEDKGLTPVGQSREFRVDNNTALETEYRINVGGSEILPDQDTGMSRRWEDDNDNGHGYYLLTQNTQIVGDESNHLIDPDDLKKYTPSQVYLTGRTSKYNMTWEFEADSKFVYMIRLHFCELDQKVQEAGDRVFQILIAETLAEPQFDVFESHGSYLSPVYKDYAVMLNNQGSMKKQNISIRLQKHPKSKYDDVILNGIEIFKVSDSSDNLGGPNPDILRSSPSNPSKNSKKTTKTPIVIAFACAAVGVVVLSVIGFLIFRCKTRPPAKGKPGNLSDFCRYFSINEIKAATNNFDDHSIIGAGGFGYVYKANIDKGEASIPVAIKRLKADSQQGVDEFETEIKLLSELRDPHLVPLIGYCNDDNEMILVYEYMDRGTLRDHLYDSNNQPLPWKLRLEICIGAAKGLLYLHTNAGENKRCVIHRDVKSTNILLDKDWVAKVSDFGLSKIGPTGLSRSHITTDVKGSLGYMDPEYYMSLRLTQKSDVYSFGVVLLEVLCGRPPIRRKAEKDEGCLVEWVRKCYNNGETEKVVDPILKGTVSPQCLNKFVQLALNCLDETGKHRPLMSEVVSGLEAALQMQGSLNGKTMIDQGKAKIEDTKSDVVQFQSDDGDSDIHFSTSDGSTIDSKSSSKVTVTSCEEERALVPAVFSKLANPKAR